MERPFIGNLIKITFSVNVVKELLKTTEKECVLWIYTREVINTELLIDCNLNRVFIQPAFTPNDLFFALGKASYNPSIRLVVIDNIAFPFLNHPDQYFLLKKFGKLLRLVVSLLPAVCLVVNYVYEDEWMPAMLGDNWGQFVDQRILFHYDQSSNNNNNEKRKRATLAKCFDKSDGCKAFINDANFTITDDLTFISETALKYNNKFPT